MTDMRDKHLTSEEIIKYMDTSDISEDYLLWMEEAAAHMLACGACQARLHRAMAAESICDEEGLAEGLKLMEREEEIRKDILIAHLSRMQEQARIAEFINHIRSGYVERFIFRRADFRKQAGVARGADTAGNTVKPDVAESVDTQYRKPQVTLEKSENKLLLRIPGEMGKEGPAGAEETCSKELQRRLMVILRREDEEPIVKEALWDEACGQFVAEVDGCEPGEKLEIYVDVCEIGE